MPDITILPANLTSLVLESYLYGVLVILSTSIIYFFATRRTLAGKNQAPRHHFTSLVFLGIASLFLVVTAHWTITIYQAFFAFIHLGTVASEDRFYADLSQPIYQAKAVCFLVAILLGDALVTYRLWIVWGRHRYIVVVPVLGLVGSGVTAGGILYVLTQWQPILRGKPFYNLSKPWVASGFISSFLTNAYSTSLIAFRIRKFTRVNSGSESRLLDILAILVESAALQTFWLVFSFMTQLAESDVEFIFTDSFPVILGISNLLIHARVGLGWSTQNSTAGTTPHKSDSGKEVV
ncbi:hypothetical protein C8J57DRAFT_545190 [Mycena rebaudengoi]|nr:hypothetical protein C8J57DRAFT_545190 [Mycena rebaudengoi]